MVNIHHDRAEIFRLQNVVQRAGDLVVLDGQHPPGLRAKPAESAFEPGKARFTIHMNIDFEILEGFAIAHQRRAEGMVLHILQGALHHQHIVRGEHRVLPRVKREADIVSPREITAFGEQRIELRQELLIQRRGLGHGIERQQIAADAHHPQRGRQLGQLLKKQIEVGQVGR